MSICVGTIPKLQLLGVDQFPVVENVLLVTALPNPVTPFTKLELVSVLVKLFKVPCKLFAPLSVNEVIAVLSPYAIPWLNL